MKEKAEGGEREAGKGVGVVGTRKRVKVFFFFFSCGSGWSVKTPCSFKASVQNRNAQGY